VLIRRSSSRGVDAVLLWTDINPIRVLVNLNTWDLLGRSRARLAYPSDIQNGQLPLESLLAAHAISDPKHPDEYRVVLLGESGIAGWGLHDEDTLAAQLTEANIRVQERRLVAYNLAYPQPSAARDLLVLDAALEYEPDLIIWFVTPAALDDSTEIIGPNRVFFDLNRERLEVIVSDHPELLTSWHMRHGPGLLISDSAWQKYVAIDDQEVLPVWLNSLFYPFFPPDLAQSDRRIGSEPVPEEAEYTDDLPGFRDMPNDTWNLLRVGCQRAEVSGASLLVVNEPMLIGSGSHSSENYNERYQRALYDRYRSVLEKFVADHGMWYADLWSVIPAENFTDTPLHADAEGYAILSASLRTVMEEGAQGLQCD
jgi:hypothetical protein